MDSPHENAFSQYAPAPSNTRRQSVRMDLNYPDLDQDPLPQSLGASPLPNVGAEQKDYGMARTTSRTRRVGGKVPVDNGERTLVLPAAPDVPKSSPPLSFRDPYVNGAVPTSVNTTPKSFAARARASPATIEPTPAIEDIQPVLQKPRQSRRTSVSRPSGIIYPQVQPPAEARFASDPRQPTSPELSSNATTPRQNRTIDPNSRHQPTSAGDSRRPSNVTVPSARSHTRRLSATAAEQRTEWAADRSPLQKLEVKLNDISKEEKRARVEEAEQLLRESKAANGYHRANHELAQVDKRTSPRRVSTAEVNDTRSREPSRRAIQAGVNLRPRAPGDNPKQVAIERPIVEGSDIPLSRRSKDASDLSQYHQSGRDLSSTLPARPTSQDLAQQDPQRPPRVVNSNKGGVRGVRFQTQEYSNDQHSNREPVEANLRRSEDTRYRTQQARLGIVAATPRRGDMGSLQHEREQTRNPAVENSIKVSKEQLDLYASRLAPSQPNDSVAVYGGAPDPIPGNAVRGHGAALKYEVPPQTASGIEAREMIGFGTGQQGGLEAPAGSKHHLTDILHRGHKNTSMSIAGPLGQPKQLDEWRQGGVARLTASDLDMDLDPATGKRTTWEEDRSGSQRRTSRSGQGSVGKSQGADGSFEGKYGKVDFSSLDTDEASADSVSVERRRTSGAVRARQYIGSEGTSRVRRRKRPWLREPASLAELGSAEDPKLTLSFVYSYSCPQLAEHDLHHLNHICRPYMDKELTRSMRSIRVRTVTTPSSFNPRLYLKCGPLLRYTGTKRIQIQTPRSRGGNSITERETWRGSVMIVTVDANSSYEPTPILRLFPQPMNLLPPPPQQVDGESGEGLPSEYVDPIAGLPKLSRIGKEVYVKPVEDLEEGVDLSRVENDDGLFEETRTAAVPTSYGKAEIPPPGSTRHKGKTRQKGGRVQEVRGVRLNAERGVTFWRFNLEVELGEQQARIAYSINEAAAIGFWVPAKGQTMNIMFHSCNGFSLSVNPDDFSGPDPLWRDVLNTHQTRPFHVMIGGGDQIYNDAVVKQSSLFQGWLNIKNPIHKQEAPFSPQLLEELETFYLERYSMWFSQGFFGMANSQIPMVNVWDDHDIIDGFGSYPHHFMSTPVFSGLGTVAFKYYMLFQHQSVPDEGQAEEPSWLLGAAPGPYINQLSRSLFMFLGKHVAFLGLDCRTERMRDEILSEASYELVFDRCRREIIEGETKHLIVLLGVPIAYPRLVWLENLLTSRVMDPVKAIGRTGLLGNFLNKFDGGVEILDDLDDHWTARNHKAERKWFIEELQDLAAEKSVRITILGGDVHLAAVGQFYSNPRLKVPKDRDYRYMPNIISSAIVNTPPPEVMGDILNKRNKVHHFDAETEEDMIPMFTHDVDGKSRNNKRLLPRRNWCQIREYNPGFTPPPTPPTPDVETPFEGSQRPPNRLQRNLSLTRNEIKPANLLRRLSQRGPPTSTDYPPSNEYRPPSAVAASPINRASTDGYFPAQPIPGSGANNTTPARQNSSASVQIRPSEFHRRPTNLSERAAKKGGAGLDSDQSGHINLEGGLDVVLNCEVNQRDPAGITVPYRLLVPALWYDGDGDANMANTKKPTWLKRGMSMVSGVSRRNTLTGRQGLGMWAGSGSGSVSGSDSQSDRGKAMDRPQGNGHGQPVSGGRVMSEPPVMNYRQRASEGPTAATGQGRKAGGLPDRYQQEGGYEQRPLDRQSMDVGQPQNRMQQQSGYVQRSQSISSEPGRGYSGIEAYKDKSKGWRKFF